MKTMLTLILASFLTVLSMTASADTQKIAVVDFQKILKNSSQMEAVGNKLKKEFKPRQDKIIALQKTLETDQQTLKRDASILNEKDLTKLRDKIASTQRDLRRLEEDYLTDARAAQKNSMQQVIDKVNGIVKKVAEQNHYDLILYRDVVAYENKVADITDDVIKELKH